MINQKEAHVIRHIAFEDLGSFEAILNDRGYSIRYLDAGYDDLNLIKNYKSDLLIVLGGPIGVYDHKDYPFLETEILILKNRIEKDLPTLGICLGAQLIARALGAEVYSGDVKEIGWSKLKLTNEGNNNYFKYLSQNEGEVLHWHGDTFHLPEGAKLQASTDIYVNQAFTYGENILALQFHTEVTERGMEKWFIGHANEISSAKEIDIAKLRGDTKKYVNSLVMNSHLFLNVWLDNVECK